MAKQLGHAKQAMTLSFYSHCLPDARRQRGADRLVAELLGATSSQPDAAGRSGTEQASRFCNC